MNVYIVFITFTILIGSGLGTFSKLLILSSYQSTTPTITVSGRMAQYLTLSTTIRSRSPENSYHGSLPEIISNPFNYYCGSAALVWILVEVEVCMVHCSLTRSDWYSLFLANRKREKRYPLPSGMERDYWYPLPSLAGNGYAQSQLAKGQSLVLLLDIQHLPVICNVRLAGDRNWRCCRFGCRRCGWRCEVGNPGTLVSPGRGNGTDFTDAGGRSLPSR